MKLSTIWKVKGTQTAIACIFWLAVWQTVSLFTPKLLFASPVQTLQALIRLLGGGAAWETLAVSLAKTGGGFLLAFLFGACFAVLCHRYKIAEVLVSPLIWIMKSVPVACFVIVALIWLSSRNISILVASFVVFPVTFASVQNGIVAADPELSEMAKVFGVPPLKKMRFLYLPQVLPSVLSGCTISVGMCWKAAIAGEIIGLPARSIGERLYLSKLYLKTDELFAWTLIIIAVSALTEKLFVKLLLAVQKRLGGGYVHET